jgi:hypothetical protein
VEKALTKNSGPAFLAARTKPVGESFESQKGGNGDQPSLRIRQQFVEIWITAGLGFGLGLGIKKGESSKTRRYSPLTLKGIDLNGIGPMLPMLEQYGANGANSFDLQSNALRPRTIT